MNIALRNAAVGVNICREAHMWDTLEPAVMQDSLLGEPDHIFSLESSLQSAHSAVFSRAYATGLTVR